jgi:carbonic anhydrase/acetyltransferase-like protein (isoleucine patch superfamily)
MGGPHIPEPVIDLTAVVAPGAHVYGQVTIGPRVFVLFGSVIRAELDRIEIGAETNIQDNAVLHCDEDIPCVLGERVTVGHSAVVHGAIVGDRTLIGIGARLLNGSVLGEGAWIGSGSVLTEGKEVPPWTLAIGTPARAVRDLTEAEITRADEGVDHYLELMARYREIFLSRTGE